MCVGGVGEGICASTRSYLLWGRVGSGGGGHLRGQCRYLLMYIRGEGGPVGGRVHVLLPQQEHHGCRGGEQKILIKREVDIFYVFYFQATNQEDRQAAVDYWTNPLFKC